MAGGGRPPGRMPPDMNNTVLKCELDSIYRANGTLTPGMVVDAARDETSPLHECFEWDDAKAGEQYRLTQAAHLIRRCRVIHETDDGGKRNMRAYLPVADPEQHRPYAYQPTREALADPVSRRLILTRMDREWRQFKARYGMYREYAELIAREAERLDIETR